MFFNYFVNGGSEVHGGRKGEREGGKARDLDNVDAKICTFSMTSIVVAGVEISQNYHLSAG